MFRKLLLNAPDVNQTEYVIILKYTFNILTRLIYNKTFKIIYYR